MLALLRSFPHKSSLLVASSCFTSKQPDRIVAVPFKITSKEAVEKIDSAVGFFDMKIKQQDTRPNKHSQSYIRAQFIPFYAGTALVGSSEYFGEYGVRRTQTYTSYERNSQTGKNEPVTRTRSYTDWYPTHGVMPAAEYSYLNPEQKNLQLCADYAYPRKTAESAFGGDLVTQLKVLSAEELAFDGTEKEVLRHSMREKIARERLWKRIYSYEEERAKIKIQSEHRVSHQARINKLQMKLDPAAITLMRYHYPAYVCKYSKNPPLYRIVNGFTGSLTGNFMVHSLKIGIITGIIFSAVAALCSLPPDAIAMAGPAGLGIGWIGGEISNYLVRRQVESIDAQKDQDEKSLTSGESSKEISSSLQHTPKSTPSIESSFNSKTVSKPNRLPQQVLPQQPKQRAHSLDKHAHSETSAKQHIDVVDKTLQSTGTATNDPADIILQDEYCKLFNLRMGKKYTLRQFTEARESAIKRWSPPSYTGNQALASSMLNQIHSVSDYTLKRSGRDK